MTGVVKGAIYESIMRELVGQMSCVIDVFDVPYHLGVVQNVMKVNMSSYIL